MESNKTSGVENHEKADKTTSATAQKKDSSDKFLRWGTFTVDALVLIAVAVYSVFAALQWRAMRDQIETMRGQLTEMKESKSLSRLDQRAWVADVGMTGKAEVDKPYMVKITVKNTGKTFAKNLTSIVASESKQIADPDPDFNAVIGKGTSSTNSVALVPPNGGFDQLFDIPQDGHRMTDTDIEGFKNPTVVVLIFGKIGYQDIFRCEHWTTFCYRAYPTKGQYDAYNAYNDADDNYCP